MIEQIKMIKDIYSDGERFNEMRVYTNRKLKIWEEEVVKLFPFGAKILNIGCGKGREAFCLDEMGFHVTAIDISEAVIESARKIAAVNKLNIDFYVSNGLDLNFNDAEFDVVIIWAQTFGLFYGETNQQHILKECKRVLKNGGILSISGHDREFLLEIYPQCLKDEYFYPFVNSELYYTTFTIHELSECVKKTYLQLINCKRGMVYTEDDGTILHCECKK